MKKFLLALVALMTVTVSARAMSYEQACRQALFLTDKMAYELNLTDDQYEAAYEVNLDYLMSISNYDELYGIYWQQRNLDLSYILLDWQYRAYLNASYFYRPLYWRDGFWHFSIYARYPHRDYFFFGRPHFFNVYRGGHSWVHNGGRSWYHGRTFGSRPGNERPGMRDGFDRGDFGRGHRGLDNNANRPDSRHGVNGGRRDVQQPRDGNRNMNNGRPRSSFGNANGGTERRMDNGAGNRPSMGNGTNNRQPGTSTEARPRTNFDRSNSTPSMRESSTRQTVTRQSSEMNRSTVGRSAEKSSSSFSNSRVSNRSVSTPSRSIGSSSRSSSSSASRSYSTPSRSMGSSSSHSVSGPSRSSSSMGHSSAGGSHGGGGGRSGGFGGHR